MLLYVYGNIYNLIVYIYGIYGYMYVYILSHTHTYDLLNSDVHSTMLMVDELPCVSTHVCVYTCVCVCMCVCVCV